MMEMTTTYWIGQDSINAAVMSHGLDFYGFYTTGSFANGTAVKADNPGKYYVGISPVVFEQTDILDVETGDATPAQIAAHLTLNKNPPNLVKPGYYQSIDGVR